jgi:hypothetical protein
METQRTYIAAQPGYSTVSLRDGQPFLSPIISWEHIVETCSPETGGGMVLFVHPVTPDGANKAAHVLYPDGTVHNVDATYGSLEAWKTAQLEHAAMLRHAREIPQRSSDEYIL